MITIGRKIRARRKEIGMTQEELAHKIGYKSKVSIGKIESDERRVPHDKMELLTEALGVSPNYLMDWKSNGDRVYFDDEKDMFFGNGEAAKNRRLILYWMKIASPEKIQAVAELIKTMGE